jgi:hypothetical protein
MFSCLCSGFLKEWVGFWLRLGSGWSEALLRPHRCPHAGFPTGDHPALVLRAGAQQLFVQSLQIAPLRHRHPVVAAKVTHVPFHSAFLMGGRRRAELCCKSPVRPKDGLSAVCAGGSLVLPTSLPCFASRSKAGHAIHARGCLIDRLWTSHHALFTSLAAWSSLCREGRSRSGCNAFVQA